MTMSRNPDAQRRSLAQRRNAPPAPKGNTRAVKSGASANPASLPGFEETREEVMEAMADAPWIARSDMPLLNIFIAEYHAYKYTADKLARVPDSAAHRRVSATKLQLRRVRNLKDLANALGLSPTARVNLGLQAAQTEAVRVQPVRTVERARQVTALLAQTGAVPMPGQPPVVDADVVESQEPEPELK